MPIRGWFRYPLGQGESDMAVLDRVADQDAAKMGGRVLGALGEQIIAGKRFYCYRIEKAGDEA